MTPNQLARSRKILPSGVLSVTGWTECIPRGSLTRMFGSITLASIFCCGCSTYRALELPDRPAHTLLSRQEKVQLVVASEAYLSRSEVERYFGSRLWAAGYFPVVVHLENRGRNTFEIQRSQLSIWRDNSASEELGETRKFLPSPPGEVILHCRRSTAPALLLTPALIFPAIWAMRQIETYNFDLTRDIESKALPAYYRIEPQDPPVRGALFFRRPDGLETLTDLFESAELRLQIKIEGSRVLGAASEDAPGEGDGRKRVGQSITFVLSLGGEKE